MSILPTLPQAYDLIERDPREAPLSHKNLRVAWLEIFSHKDQPIKRKPCGGQPVRSIS